MNIYSYVRNAAFAFMSFVLISGSASATTWYFSPTGSDSNTGSASSPWVNPSNHNSSYRPGDTLEVEAGTYTPTYGWGLTASGSASGGYITLQCWRNFASHVVVTTANMAGIFLFHGAAYWDIRGCDIAGSGLNASAISVGGSFSAPFGAVHHIVIENNSVHGASCAGIGVGGNGNISGGTAYPVDYITIRNNNVYQNSTTSSAHCSGIDIYEPIQYDTLPGYHLIIQGNVVDWNNDCDTCTTPPTDGNGIILDSFNYSGNPIPGYTTYSPATLIAGNTLYDNGGKGIHVFQSQNVTISGNYAWGDNEDATVCANTRGGGDEIDALYSKAITVTGNEAQASIGTCSGYQTYAFADVPNGTSSSDTFTNNTGFATVGTTVNVGYSAGPPSAYFSSLSGYSFGSTNR